ncbi:MAG: O-antigen ligase family protein [Pseudomonadota bacterium]
MNRQLTHDLRSHGVVPIAILFWAVGVPFLGAAFLLSGSRQFSYVFYAGTFFFFFAALLKAVLGRGTMIPVPLLFSYALFFLVLLLATLRSQLLLPFAKDILQFRSLLGLWVWSLVMVLVPQFLRSSQDVTRFLRLFDVTGLVIAGTVFISFFGVDFGETIVFDTGERRAFGPVGDQVGFVLSFFAVRAICLRNWLRFVLYVCAILATATRGAIFTVFVGVLVVTFLNLRRDTLQSHGQSLGRGILRWFGILLSIGLLFFVLVATPFGTYFLERFTNPESLGMSAIQRLGAMLLAMDVVMDHPWLGVGFYGYSGAVWNYSPLYYFPFALDPAILQNFIATASNQYLQTLSDAGFLGFAALMALIASAIFVLGRAQRTSEGVLRVEAAGLLGWCVALVLGNQTACWLLPDSLIGYIWFFCVGVGTAILSISLQSKADLTKCAEVLPS